MQARSNKRFFLEQRQPGYQAPPWGGAIPAHMAVARPVPPLPQLLGTRRDSDADTHAAAATAADFPPGRYRALYELPVRSSISTQSIGTSTLPMLCVDPVRRLPVGEEMEVLEVVEHNGQVFGSVALESEWILLYWCIYGNHYAERIADSTFVQVLTLHVAAADQGFVDCSATNIAGDELTSMRVGEDVLIPEVCRLIATELCMAEDRVRFMLPDGQELSSGDGRVCAVDASRAVGELLVEESLAVDEDLT